MIRALGFGTILGLAVSGLALWAFARGCPIFDIEHDSILGF